MTQIETEKYQTCEFCHRRIKIDHELPTVILPCRLGNLDSFAALSICGDCARKLHQTLNADLELEEIEYSGVVCRWRREEKQSD